MWWTVLVNGESPDCCCSLRLALISVDREPPVNYVVGEVQGACFDGLQALDGEVVWGGSTCDGFEVLAHPYQEVEVGCSFAMVPSQNHQCKGSHWLASLLEAPNGNIGHSDW